MYLANYTVTEQKHPLLHTLHWYNLKYYLHEGDNLAKKAKKKAKKRIDDLPPLLPKFVPRPLRRAALPVRLVDEGSRFLAKELIDIDPLGRFPSGSGARSTPEPPAFRLDLQQDNRFVNISVFMLDDGSVAQIIPDSRQFERQNLLPKEDKPKSKRKRSKYNIELTKQLNKLKSERPRTKVINLMKEAHRRTRKALK